MRFVFACLILGVLTEVNLADPAVWWFGDSTSKESWEIEETNPDLDSIPAIIDEPVENGVPSRPEDLRAEALEQLIRLGWHQQKGASYYLVSAGDRSWPVAGDTSQFVIRTPDYWKEYVLYVKACNVNNKCSPSSNITTRSCPGAPSSPRNLNAEINGTDIVVTWEEPLVKNGPVSGYNISYGYGYPHRTDVNFGETLSYLIPNFSPLRSYNITLSAFNSKNLFSKIYGPITGVSIFTPPKPPTQLRVYRRSESHITLSWTDETKEAMENYYYESKCRSCQPCSFASSSCCGFKISLCNGSECGLSKEVQETRYSFDGLQSATEYTAMVKAFYRSLCEIHESSPSILNFETSPPDIRDVTARALGSTVVILSWTNPKPKSTIRYNLTWGRFATHHSLSTYTNHTSLVVDNLLPCTSYDFEVQPCLRISCGSYQIVLVTTFPAELMPPEIITIKPISSTKIYLEWDTVATNDTSSSGYCPMNFEDFEVRICSGFCRVIDIADGRRKLTVSGLRAKTSYTAEVRIRVRNGEEEILSPRAVAVVSTMDVVPAKPKDLEAVALSATVVRLNWEVPDSIVTHHQISYDDRAWMNSSQLPAFLYSLEPYHNYTFIVRSCNDVGCGMSESVEVATLVSAPSKPENFKVLSSRNGTVELRWNPPLQPAGPVNGYRLWWNCSDLVRDVRISGRLTYYLIENVNDSNECIFGIQAYNVLNGKIIQRQSSEVRPNLITS